MAFKGEHDDENGNWVSAAIFRAFMTVQEGVGRFLLSTNFQCGMQLMLGMIVVALFIFIRELTFPQACLSATFYIVCALIVSQDTNVGTKLIGCSMIVGSAGTGYIVGGALVSLAKQVDGWQPYLHYMGLPADQRPPAAAHAQQQFQVYTAVLCVLAVVGLGVLSVNRMGQSPPFLWVLGMNNCLACGVAFISAQFVPDVHSVWREVVAYLLLDTAIAAGVASGVSMLVLPRLATHEMRSCLSLTATGIGAAVSRYAGRLTVQEPGLIALCRVGRTTSGEVSVHLGTAAAAGGGGTGESATDDDIEILDNEVDDEAFVAMVNYYTAPAMAPVSPNPSFRGGQRAPALPHLGPPVSVLWPTLSRAKACIPNAMAEPAFMTGGAFDAGTWARVAAAAEELLGRVGALELLVEEKEQVLRSDTMVQYFGADKVPVFQKALAQVAASCGHVGMLLDLGAPCKVHPVGVEAWQETREELAAAITVLYRKYWKRIIHSSNKPRLRLPDAFRVRAIFFAWVLTKGLVDAAEALEAAALAATAPPPPHQKSFLSWIRGQTAFGVPLVQICLGVPMWYNLKRWLAQDLPHFFSRKGFQAALHSRTFQAGVKYWLALSTVLLLILSISARDDGSMTRTFRPAFGYIAASLCMSEKVEATISKVAIWVGGSVLGGTLGYVVMLNASLSTNPYALMAIVCAVTLLTGLAATIQFRMAVVLTLMTFQAMILCQYQGCCDATGSKEFFAVRLLAVILGCSIPVLLCNAILPWFNSQWALKVLGDTFEEAVQAAEDAYAVCFQEGEQAAAATREQGCDGHDHPIPGSRKGGGDGGGTGGAAAAPAAESVISAAIVPEEARDAVVGPEQEGGGGEPADGAEVWGDAAAAAAAAAAALPGREMDTLSSGHVAEHAAAVAPGVTAAVTAATTAAALAEELPQAGPAASPAAATLSEPAGRLVVLPGMGSAATAVASATITASLPKALQPIPEQSGASVAAASKAGAARAAATSTASAASKAAVAAIKAPLRERIVRPVVGVQVGLIKDGVVWSRGLLATPKIVPKVMIPMFGLMDRLTALQLMMLLKPELTGHWTGWAFSRILQPVDVDFRAMFAAMHEMAAATSQLLRTPKQDRPKLMVRVAEAIEELQRKRMVIRRHIIEGRRKMVRELSKQLMEPAAVQDLLMHPDDFVRVLGFLFAVVKTVDQTTKVARAALMSCTKRQDEEPSWLK